jgi:hypothetical protein
MTSTLSGTVAFVTGASSGIGARLRRSTGEVPPQAETRRYCRGEHREADAQ